MENHTQRPAHDPVAALLSQMPSMLAYWDSDLQCRFANQSYGRWFGLEAERVIGMSLQDLLGPERFALNADVIEGVLAGRAQQFERTVTGADGISRHSLFQLVPDRVDGRVAGFVVQVTEVARLQELTNALREESLQRERTTALLAKSEQALRRAQSLGQIGSWEWEVDADVVTWSRELYRLFGRDASRLPPRFAEQAALFEPLSWAQLEMAVKRCIGTGQSYRLELEYRATGGRVGWVEARGQAEYDQQGRVIALQGTAQDITLQRHARQMQLHANTLSEARQALQVQMQENADLRRALAQAKKLEVLGLLAGGVAHDFNNVLAAVSGAFHLLKRTATDARSQENVQRGQRGVERATRLVRQLMGFARTQALHAEVLDVCETLESCLELLKVTAGPRVKVTLECQGSRRAFLDPNQLEVALLNLVINARDAMPDGGKITIAVGAEPAHDALSNGDASGHGIAIAVGDTGHGMTAEVLAHAREPFFTTKGAGEGTGLGLAMVNAFVQRSGGRFTLDSLPQAGTTATLWFPIATVDALPARAGSDTIDFDLHGRATVLVVDDDPMVRPVAVAYLQELGYTVLEAADASQALEIIAGTQPIALVVSDVAMPEIDGADLAAQIRKVRVDLPILLMTGHADRRRLVGEEVIDKPFTIEALAACVLRLLGRGEGTAARLAARIKHPALRALHADWLRLHSSTSLPSVQALELERCQAPDHVFVAQVVDLAPFTMRRMHVGSALTRYAGGEPLDDAIAADEEGAFGGLEGAYRRSARLREPSYEFLRFRADEGYSVVFERLLLPCQDTHPLRHQLVGMVFFDNLPSQS